jgi:hypothetical protein
MIDESQRNAYQKSLPFHTAHLPAISVDRAPPCVSRLETGVAFLDTNRPPGINSKVSIRNAAASDREWRFG